MTDERTVAGLRCGEVLEALSDYVDGELDPKKKAQIEAHLEGCSWCEQFGGEFSQVVTDLRRALRAPEPVPDDVAQRLEGLFADEA